MANVPGCDFPPPSPVRYTVPSAAMATPSPCASPTGFRSTRPASSPIAREQIRRTMKCEALLGPQHHPCAIKGHGTVRDPFGFGGLPRCARFAHTFELMGGARSQFSRESVQPDGVRFTLRHDEEAPSGATRSVSASCAPSGYVAWNVSLTTTESSVEGSGDAMNRDALVAPPRCHQCPRCRCTNLRDRLRQPPPPNPRLSPRTAGRALSRFLEYRAPRARLRRNRCAPTAALVSGG